MDGVSLFTFSSIAYPQGNWTENEKFIREHALNIGRIAADVNAWTTALDCYYDKKTIREVLTIPPSYHGVDGVRHLEDFNAGAVNIVGGHRVTTDQPEAREKTIYIVGGCDVFGIGSDDGNTIASHLQRLVNREYPADNIVVQNYGFFLAEMDSRGRYDEELAIIKSLPAKKGDVILYAAGQIEGISHIDGSDVARRNGTELFFDQQHYTPDGNRVVAENIFKGLRDQGCLSSEKGDERGRSSNKVKDYGFTHTQSRELDEYKKILTNFYDEMFVPVMGSIVMNCNPFTLGHRYLIEEALKQCDFLSVFIVEEDKSVFAFDERLHMADEGTKDLENVAVIPSGNFVLSTLTFSEYFNKAELQDRKIDPSLDIVVFAKEIAPCLHITKRFAGEEPTDAITRQYNAAMKRILPEYGIEFVEIPRKGINDDVISASKVRKSFNEKKLEELKVMVPNTTYEILRDKIR